MHQTEAAEPATTVRGVLLASPIASFVQAQVRNVKTRVKYRDERGQSVYCAITW